MIKEQFINKFINLNISKAELSRKWQMHLREQEDIELMQHMQSTGGAGGVIQEFENDYTVNDYIVIDYFTM
jgi:hypothetical protein